MIAQMLDMSNADYHKHKSLSFTHLKELIFTGAHYQAWLQAEREDTVPMLIGRAVHCKILTPELFDVEFIVEPETEFRTAKGEIAKNQRLTKEYKDWLEAFKLEHKGKSILTPAQFQQVKTIADVAVTKIVGSEELAPLLNGVTEKSFFFEAHEAVNPNSGPIVGKCRPDILTDSGVVVDLKIVDSVSFDSIQGSIASQHYYMQAAWYLDGVNKARAQGGLNVPEAKACVYVFIEREAPHEIRCFCFSDTMINYGREVYTRALNNYVNCVREQKWFGYPRTIEVMELPNWLMYKNNLKG